MPNGGTDNCMNCPHNRVNKVACDPKAASRFSRQAFCTVYQIPIASQAWTYCRNTLDLKPGLNQPVYRMGLREGGYSRVPIFGLRPIDVGEPISDCHVCGGEANAGIVVELANESKTLSFCCNGHYCDWHDKKTSGRNLRDIDCGGQSELTLAVIDNEEPWEQERLTPNLLNQVDAHGWSAIHYAALLGRYDWLKAMLAAGTGPTVQTTFEKVEPIELAASEGNKSIVDLLLSSYAHDQNLLEQILHKACQNGHLLLVEALLGADVDIDCRNSRGSTPLLHAVFEGHLTLVIYLLDQGANIHATDNFGNTALSFARTWKTSGMEEIREVLERWLARENKAT